MHSTQIVEYSPDNKEAILSFSIAEYPLDVLQRAAYRLTDRCFAKFSGSTDIVHQVVLSAKVADLDIRVAAGEFCNAVLDESLRKRIRDETAIIRNLIFAQAFSDVELLDTLRDGADYRDDPLDIGSTA